MFEANNLAPNPKFWRIPLPLLWTCYKELEVTNEAVLNHLAKLADQMKIAEAE